MSTFDDGSDLQQGFLSTRVPETAGKLEIRAGGMTTGHVKIQVEIGKEVFEALRDEEDFVFRENPSGDHYQLVWRSNDGQNAQTVTEDEVEDQPNLFSEFSLRARERVADDTATTLVEIGKFTFESLQNSEDFGFKYNEVAQRYILAWKRDQVTGGVSAAGSNGGCRPGGS